MTGNELMPLNQMQATHPDLYQKNIGKYSWRKEVLERRIPLLDCLWNDVLHFSPVHPHKIFKLQLELGLIREIPPYIFYEIYTDSFEPEKTVVFFKSAPGKESEVVKWIEEIDLSKIQEIPQATVDYYKTLIGTGELPLNYQFVPHIFYMGNVDISQSRIITISE